MANKKVSTCSSNKKEAKTLKALNVACIFKLKRRKAQLNQIKFFIYITS